MLGGLVIGSYLASLLTWPRTICLGKGAAHRELGRKSLTGMPINQSDLSNSSTEMVVSWNCRL